MTIHDTDRPAAPAAGDPAEYDLAAALAVATEALADAVDDNRPGWLAIAQQVGDLLARLVTARLDAEACGEIARGSGSELPGVLDGIFASFDMSGDAGLWTAAADLSATAGDIAADLAEGRSCPAHVALARRLLGTLADAIGDGSDFPPVVCLCGSTRFVDEFNRQRRELTERGEIVLSIEVVTTQAREHDPQHADPALKARLDELHKRKIDLADYVLVLNVGGYIGDSTRSEIDYATAHGKPVRYLTGTPAEDTQ
jgi:hypothetical protein